MLIQQDTIVGSYGIEGILGRGGNGEPDEGEVKSSVDEFFFTCK